MLFIYLWAEFASEAHESNDNNAKKSALCSTSQSDERGRETLTKGHCGNIIDDLFSAAAKYGEFNK